MGEQAGGELGSPEADLGQIEQAPARLEKAPQANPASAALTVPLPALPTIPAQQSVDLPTTQIVVPNALDDGDLIEKEWVTKAKQIVEANRDDPFKQSEELTVFRADYMKKRYNKSIKVSK